LESFQGQGPVTRERGIADCRGNGEGASLIHGRRALVGLAGAVALLPYGVIPTYSAGDFAERVARDRRVN